MTLNEFEQSLKEYAVSDDARLINNSASFYCSIEWYEELSRLWKELLERGFTLNFTPQGLDVELTISR